MGSSHAQPTRSHHLEPARAKPYANWVYRQQAAAPVLFEPYRTNCFGLELPRSIDTCDPHEEAALKASRLTPPR